MPEQNANYADMAEAFYDLPPVASIRIFRDLGLRYILRFQAQLQADEEACRNALSAASAAQTPQSGLATSDDIDVYHSQQRLIADTEKRLDKYCMRHYGSMLSKVFAKRFKSSVLVDLLTPR